MIVMHSRADGLPLSTVIRRLMFRQSACMCSTVESASPSYLTLAFTAFPLFIHAWT
jgi:hypothetical protein